MADDKPCGTKDCTLHGEVIARIDAMRDLMDERKVQVGLQMAAIENSTKLAKKEMDRRLEGMNELRAQLDRQAGTFATKEYVDGIAKESAGKVDVLRSTMDTRSGSARWSDYLVMAIIAAIISAMMRWTV